MTVAAVAALVFGLLFFWAQTQRAVLRDKLLQEGEQMDALHAQLREQQTNKEKIAGLEAELSAQRQNADERGEELKQERAETNNLREQKKEDAKTITALEKDLEGEKKKAEMQAQTAQKNEEFITKSQEEMADKFKTLAQSILDEKQKALGTSSVRLLLPLQEELKSFRKRVDDIHTKGAEQHAALNQHIDALQKNTQQISSDATELTQSLKGSSKVRGDWGEVMLERLLQDSGLREGAEYKIQESLSDGDGKQKRPDVLIYLPNNRRMIIDSKVSLNYYVAAVAADDKKEQKKLLAQHVDAVRRHIDELSKKDYSDLKGLNAPDFVFLFMPIEPALLAALQGDDGLYQYAYKRKVILTAPTTLMGVMKIVERIWRIERQNQNANLIAEQGGKLYDKFADFVADMQEIDKALGKAQSAHGNAMKKLKEGRGNLVGQAEKMRNLGVKVQKQLPPEIIGNADDD